MKAVLNMSVGAMLALIVTSGYALAQDATSPEARLKEKNITLPQVPPPVANYVDAVRVGNLLFLSGNTPDAQWKFKGKVGKDITVEEGYQTARQVGLIMLAKVRNAVGSLDRVKRVVKVFSDLMVEVVGEAKGKHARSAVGMAGLPFNNAVEVEMIVEIE